MRVAHSPRGFLVVLAAAFLTLAGGCTAGTDAPAGPDAEFLLPAPAGPDAQLATAQGTVTIAWSNSPGGVAVAVDAADNVYTARWDYNPAGDIYLAKRNSAGALLWEVRYDNTNTTQHEVATWVGTDPSGNIFVSGTIRSGYSNPVNANSLLMKFAPDGSLLWRQVYTTTFDGSSTRKLLVDAAGNAYVLGLGTSPAGQRTTIRKFSPTGATVWAWFDPMGIGAPINFKWSPDGALLISARAIYGSINGYAKVDQNGATVWTLAGLNSITVGDVAGDGAGNAYLVNGDYPNSGSRLRKVGPTAATLWERTHPMAAFRVEVGADNAPILSGFPNSGTVGAAFSKLDPAGNLLWTNLDADGPGIGLLAHAQLRLDAAGDAYLAAGTMSQMGVTKVLGSTGVSDWTAIVPFGYAAGLAFGQGGRVFVTGGTTARLDQGPGGPPQNTPPVVTIAATSFTRLRINGTLKVQATLVDPDAGDGPWSYVWRWGNGPTSGTWAAPGTFAASRVYTRAGTYNVRLIVTDASGAADTSNVIPVSVR